MSFTRLTWKKLLLLGSIILSSSSCVHIEPLHTGVVIDNETKRPLDGVVATMHLGSREFFGTSVQDDAYECSSDSGGRFHLSPAWKWTRPLEFFTTRELYFHKAGYFTARIVDPRMSERIELHRVRYLSDFRRYQKQATENMSLYFLDKQGEKAVLFANEMEKIASLSADHAGEPGLFAEVPGSTLTRLVCATYGVHSPSLSHSETYAVSGFPCCAFDVAQERWSYLTPEGRAQNAPFSVPAGRDLITWNNRLQPVVFANNTSIYDPSTLTPPRTIKPQKGDITSVAGDWLSVLSVEDDGKYLCSYPLHFLNRSSCIAIDTESSGGRRLLAVAKFYEGPQRFFYGISRSGDYYIVHRISDTDDHGRPTLNVADTGKIPADAPFKNILVAPGGAAVYLLLENGLRKFYAPQGQKSETLQEDKEFADAFRRLPFANKVRDLAIQDGLLYIVTGDANVYRVLENGAPDFKISLHL